MNKASRPLSEMIVELLRDDPSFANEYLDAAMEEVDQEGGPQALLSALRNVLEARGFSFGTAV